MFKRKKTRKINVGGVIIGGDMPIVVQSMCKTDTRDEQKTLSQIKKLHKAKCEIVRLAVPDMTAGESFAKIASKSPLPLVADIHFDYRLALFCAENGASKIRFNPGNIGSKENLRQLVSACKKNNLPIRIGVNAGSLEKEFSDNNAGNIVKSALKHVHLLEKEGFLDICISAKASSVAKTIEANRLLSEHLNYPLHIGITESGIPKVGVIKNAVGVGTLLAEGIGDTLRISLTADPVEEVETAYHILESLELRKYEREFVSCPGCGRTEADHRKIAKEVFEKTRNLSPNLKIAVMGCVVNGVGEAGDADFALVAGKKVYAIYQGKKMLKTVPENKAVEDFLMIISQNA